MKKILICLAVFLFEIPAFAQNETTFIYLNGSNTNTEKSRDEFIEGIDNLHKEIILNFNKNNFFKNCVLKEGRINSVPIPFYWGDFSKNEIKILNEEFDYLKSISPRFAKFVRQFIALCLHDAIWVSKAENMYPILEKLHQQIKEEHEQGNKVVLVGYSAGTFIVNQYLFFKMPSINLKNEVSKSEYGMKYSKYMDSLEDTCIDAIYRSKIVTYDIFDDFVFEDNEQSFKEKISKLNNYTKLYCAPKESISGGINFASPFVLFYSDMLDEQYKSNKILGLSYKYIVENGLFWLTVNYADDPLGFPTSKNLNFEEVEKMTKTKLNPNGGFIYDKSDKSSRRTFLMAHLAYFKTAKRYSKILSDALTEGYEHFYK